MLCVLTTAFVLPTALPLRRTQRQNNHVNTRKPALQRIRQTRCQTNQPAEPDEQPKEVSEEVSQQIPSPPPPEPMFGRFDAESDTDAFGRDPKKETEFWKDHARSVLESAEVRDAIEQHAKDGGDGLTDEQRAYMEFIRQLDEDKGDADAGGKGEP